MPEPHVYDDRPDAEVLVDGQWWPAELRMRTESAGRLVYNAAWHRDGHTYLDTFPADHVRVDTVDRSLRPGQMLGGADGRDPTDRPGSIARAGGW